MQIHWRATWGSELLGISGARDDQAVVIGARRGDHGPARRGLGSGGEDGTVLTGHGVGEIVCNLRHPLPVAAFCDRRAL
jgi:hypothetical protein